MSENKEDGNDDDNEELVATAHYIMVHYAKKEAQKRCRKKYKPKSGQYQLEAGIKHFRDQGEIAVTKEVQQFNTYGVFEPKLVDELADNDKKKVLASLIFQKEKTNGDNKARSCANGSKQREHIAKEEAAALTVALESVFITAAIDAKEHWKVVTIDIPGAFLHANNEDYVNENGWDTGRTNGEDTSPVVQEKCFHQKGLLCTISPAAKSLIWNDEKRITLL
jgi:hypothetical protein